MTRERGENVAHGAPAHALRIVCPSQDFYRIRQGRYRIVYEVNDGLVIVHVIRVGHRGSVYKTL